MYAGIGLGGEAKWPRGFAECVRGHGMYCVSGKTSQLLLFVAARASVSIVKSDLTNVKSDLSNVKIDLTWSRNVLCIRL
jgi:hypothetical protein